ncbi:MAG: Large-conductance mechanosensitive channel [Gemmatimonadetes bacterium]|nr:Large-conductance mechanosensitive channel [Gemmatimonadota bacterium]
MWKDFKAFLIKQNALALAIAVVIGAALNTVVKAVVDDIIMPIVGYASPAGAWQKATLDAGPVKFGVGDLAASLLNFLIVGLVAWRLSRMFIRDKVEAKPAVKSCQFCRMGDLDVAASRCPHCTSQLA